MPSRQQQPLRRPQLPGQHQSVRRQADSSPVKKNIYYFTNHIEREKSFFNIERIFTSFTGDDIFEATN